MSYEEMTPAEWDAVTVEFIRLGITWREYYWASSPPWWQVGKFIAYHRDPHSRYLRAACRKYGGFDPLYPLHFQEF